MAQLAEAAAHIVDITHSIMADPVLNTGENAFASYRVYNQFCGEMEHRLQKVTDKLGKVMRMQQRSSCRLKRRSPSPCARSTLCYYHE